jgi:prepilin-type N-terminal cleavage/methylation domain-containing protein
MRRGSASRSGQAGFTLIELSISLALLLLALGIAAQLLMETSQLFAETSGESLDTPVPLVLARIRGDVQGAAGAFPVFDDEGSLVRIVIQGLESQILYTRAGPNLYRTVEPAGGGPRQISLLWRGVTGWSCRHDFPKGLIELEVTYRRRSVPRTPLPALPAVRGKRTEVLTQRMFLLPRGAGLGETW